MPVTTLTPMSCRVQDYVNAWLSARATNLFLVDPTTKKIIENRLVDLPAVAISGKFQHRPAMGYKEITIPGETKADDRVFEIGAVLVMEFDITKLSPELQAIEGKFWLFEVEEGSLLDEVQALSEDLFAKFQINIVIKPAEVKDEDPHHLETSAVSAIFPGVAYCPIIPKKEI